MLEVTLVAIEANPKVDLKDEKQTIDQELSVPSQGSKDLCFDSQSSQSFVAQSIACLWKHLSYWRNTSYTINLKFSLLPTN
ncbi:Pleiotropic drug resistance protein TUR2, partial [Mucuna pruriens]